MKFTEVLYEIRNVIYPYIQNANAFFNTNKENIDAVANNIDNVNLAANNESNINAVNANKINIDTLALITNVMQSLYADKAKLTSLFNDKLTLDGLHADKLTLDGLRADKTTLDSIHADKTTLDALYLMKAKFDSIFADKAKLDSIFASKIVLDSLYADKATLDGLRADKTTLDALFAIKSKLETLFANLADINTNASNITDIQNAYDNALIAIQKATESNSARDLALAYRNQAETFKNQAQAIAGGTIVATNVQFADLTSLDTYRTNTTNALNAINVLLNSDDTSLDTLQELVAFIKAEKATLDSLGIANISGLATALSDKLDATANAVSASKLASARNINGTSFDGTADINIECRLGTIASAGTTTIGTVGLAETLHVTGTVAITNLGVASKNGVTRTLIFDGILTLTHNATSLILPTGANITTAVGDSAEFTCENGASGYWRLVRYTRANGTPLILGSLSTTGSAATLTTARTINGVSFNGSANINIEARIGTIASAATTTIGTAGLSESLHVTGPTTITSLGTATTAGIMRTLIFDGILTLTHNATTLVLPDDTNIVTAINDSAEFIADTTTKWRLLRYTRKTGNISAATMYTSTSAASGGVDGDIWFQY